MHTIRRLAAPALLSAAMLGAPATAHAQAVVAAWGNVDGIRVEGEVVPFETSVCLVDGAGAVRARTARERQTPRFARSGARRTITTRLGPFAITEVVEDVRGGEATRRSATGPVEDVRGVEARLDLTVTADSATAARAYLCIDVPRSVYAIARTDGRPVETRPADSVAAPHTGAVASARRLVFTGREPAGRRSVAFDFGAAAPILVASERREGRDFQRVLVSLVGDATQRGATAHRVVSIVASGTPDRAPVHVAIDAARPGRVFDGLGGNFRIQNPTLDPKVIAYNLANLRVAWARVEMPWRTWDPDTTVNPASRDTAQLEPRVRAAMEMARTMARRGAPVIVSAWFPPQWAVVGPLPQNGAPVNGQRGNPLDATKLQRIYASLTSYLLYLKEHYGVEPWAFSFNESDLGIDVRQTPQEHLELIKGLGAYVQSKGLRTKMLLGDVSDATPTWFIRPALQDSASWRYVGAVSFHSWRGWSDSLLTFWRDAAKKVGVPLLVAEGSTDAGAYRYPLIFQEPDFALPEIQLYVRMLALSEPKSILQWQLTSDYSLLAGGGLFGDTTALRPTQRFWNLKQLASPPAGLAHLPVTCEREVSCAALGSAERGIVVVHLVNMAAARPAMLTGLPREVTSLRVWTTDATRGMAEGPRVPVRGGRARVPMDAASYVTVLGTRGD